MSRCMSAKTLQSTRDHVTYFKFVLAILALLWSRQCLTDTRAIFDFSEGRCPGLLGAVI